MENYAISEKKKSYGLHQHRSVRPVLTLLCEENCHVFVDFFFFINFTRWHEEGAIIHLKSTIISCDTSAVYGIKDSSCDATPDGPQRKLNKVISNCYARKCEKMASS